ncbi:peptidase T [Acidaminobacter hydrogenoformans]|uniref:Peptidase T n=1 Tax=Acidaminobacter hydrogenoformans DSM 2784 TaxID=1120920 RepID=A0A1G5RU73_9FIRM|nr:peptidase T [Acidaminobacter hydrogenoformans]SCZ77633.1 peptidase T. Metallo peptidase. MEROPS family M20B [Acidaminobacter hydrogenoformans DSM 2784]
MNPVHERFLRYVKIDTASDQHSNTTPSTRKQFDLAKILFEEMKAMGLDSVSLDDNGYLMAELPGNIKAAPVIGLIAHMDTSPDFTAAGVNPQIVKNYDGGDLLLNPDQGIVMSPADFPELLKYIGQDLITTDGTTLLGADDKAGIAEILTAVEYLMAHPEIPRGDLKIGFTPDEEVGRGADHFDVEKFAADFAYTLDGGELGELEYENFNAASATVKFNGRNIHPGNAKDKMVNSLLLSMAFNTLLPAAERPEHTEGYEGFFHLNEMKGDVEHTELHYIIRDHDMAKFEARKALMTDAAAYMNQRYGSGTVELSLTDSYFNMKEKIVPVMEIVEAVKGAMEAVGVKPLIKAIRGGTDGSRLSYMGLPTPNIFTGGHNYHGRFEYIPMASMDKAVEVIVETVRRFAEKAV